MAPVTRPRGAWRVVAALAALALLAVTDGCVNKRERRVTGLLEQHASGLDDGVRRQIVRALMRAERRHGVDSLLALAIIERESRFDPQARGPAGGCGLMQIREATARAVSKDSGVDILHADELFDPLTNVLAGTAYLARMRERFGDWHAALAAYNLGPTKVARAVRQGRRPRSNYATAVMKRYNEWLESIGETPE